MVLPIGSYVTSKAYGVYAVIGVAVYVANDGRSNILGVGDTEYVGLLSFKR